MERCCEMNADVAAAERHVASRDRCTRSNWSFTDADVSANIFLLMKFNGRDLQLDCYYYFYYYYYYYFTVLVFF